MQLAVNVIMKEDNDSDTRHGLLDTMTENFGTYDRLASLRLPLLVSIVKDSSTSNKDGVSRCPSVSPCNTAIVGIRISKIEPAFATM